MQSLNEEDGTCIHNDHVAQSAAQDAAQDDTTGSKDNNDGNKEESDELGLDLDNLLRGNVLLICWLSSQFIFSTRSNQATLLFSIISLEGERSISSRTLGQRPPLPMEC